IWKRKRHARKMRPEMKRMAEPLTDNTELPNMAGATVPTPNSDDISQGACLKTKRVRKSVYVDIRAITVLGEGSTPLSRAVECWAHILELASKKNEKIDPGCWERIAHVISQMPRGQLNSGIPKPGMILAAHIDIATQLAGSEKDRKRLAACADLVRAMCYV